MHLDREMSHLVVCPPKNAALKWMRRAVLILPIFFCGCFDHQSTTKQPAKTKGTGIASVSRFFIYSRDNSSSKDGVENVAPVPSAYSTDIAADPGLREDISENRIAMPSFMGAGENDPKNPFRAGSASRSAIAKSGNQQASNFRNAASLVFNTPFNLIFSRLFNPSRSDDVALEVDLEVDLKDDLPNPFTEARLKQESSENKEVVDNKTDVKTDVADNQADSEKQAAEDNSKSEDDSASLKPSAPIAPEGTAGDDGFLIIGDFDGSGMLRAMRARRSGDTRFVSSDGERNFNLYINSAAVQDQRSFYVDDINLDEIPDILVTSATTLFGGVLLGDGDGGYYIANTFVTGYSPTVPCAGPVRNGRREILAMGMSNNGFFRAFSYSNDKYLPHQTERVGFVPNYLLHLVAPETSLHYLLIAQRDGAEQIWSWGNDGLLKPTAGQLGADAGVLAGDFGSYSMRAYQVGDYASIVLSSQGKSFNVANMRLLPRSYIVIGDLRRRGNLDVAVGDLQSFASAQSNH